MSKKIFKSILMVAMVTLLITLTIITGCMYRYFGGVQETQLLDELGIAAQGTEVSGKAFLEGLVSDRYRITWIDQDGTVLFDNRLNAESMENHADREEIHAAFEFGSGSSTRYSTTLTEKTIYKATKLSDGTVLRISSSRTTVVVLLWGMLQPIFLVIAIAAVLSAFLGIEMANHIVKPLNRLDLEEPLENDTYEELSPLLRRIDRQQKEIRQQMTILKQKQDEFDQITGNMHEGLVLLDENGKIVSINAAAQELFHAERNCEGKDFLTIFRNNDMRKAIELAKIDHHAEYMTQINGMEYQFDISRIDFDDIIIGEVILAFDITEQIEAESRRQEFTANVSHELKTPLQGILGYADIIEQGLAKKEDIPRFVSHIRKEATRLISLIEDIIRLSQLDEGIDMPLQEVSLLEISKEVCAELSETAKGKAVTLRYDGECGTVKGVSRLLFEIVYNLCDNAIKYNKEGGSVNVAISEDDAQVCLEVSDTGIGIAMEQQKHIFERFYRVDKSHSKQSGGTGLGLSIVKHAVAYHHGEIKMESELEKGTSIFVVFPKE